MKTLIAVCALAAVLGSAAFMVHQRLALRHAGELAEQQAVWTAEKAALEAALAAKERPEAAPLVPRPAPLTTPTAPVATKASAGEIIARLRTLPATPGRPRAARQAIQLLEELIAIGPDALPAIRAVLNGKEDANLLPGDAGKNIRDSFTGEFLVPPSLRFGLFDVVKQIGGADAEKLLAEALSSTGQGIELAWLARALQEMAPNGYRDAALAAARTLLALP